MENRIEWIDIAKGIGILFVIAGHTFCLGYSYPLYAFHMPLFFFLSGLLFKDKKEGFADFLKSKTNSLIRPWLIILFISFLVCLAIPQWRSDITLNAVLSDLYTSNTNVFQNSSLWYLVCFYFVLLIFFFVNKIKRCTTTLYAFLFIAIALLWIKELLDVSNLPYHRLPFKIDSALIALCFFILAYWKKDKYIKLIITNYRLLLLLFFVVLSATLSVLNGSANINSLIFGRIKLLYYPIALMGITSVILVSRQISLSHYSKLKKILVFYGKNSLLIFGFQSLLIRLYLLFFNNMVGLNMKLYDNNPIVHQIGSFIVVSFVLSPLIVWMFSMLRKNGIQIM